MTKGMTPIAKNIIVKDIDGNYVGTTYPKRARGLLKKGRAVSVDEFTIQMIGNPPSVNTIGGKNMDTKEALLAAIEQMTEVQMNSLLFLLNSFNSENTPEIVLPTTYVQQNDPRSEMVQTLKEQINVLAKDGYNSPNTVDVLKELKDMHNILMRV